ncbi:MAG: hypothetical protein H6836_07850 [Planctomycetes bacterium]|nr:hypothetical protein [Planctomycetota bacterium]
MLPLRPVLSILACLVAVAPIVGQSKQRARALGEVQQSDGKPWVGVKVVLVSARIPLAIGVLPEADIDTVEAVTDARGRFRADVLRNRAYAAWAVGEPGRDGGCRRTTVAENVLAGAPCLLREDPKRSFAHRIRFRRVDGWAERAPLRVRLLYGGTKHKQTLEMPLGDEGEFTVPPLPGERFSTVIVGKVGPPILMDRANRVSTKASHSVRVRDLPKPRVRSIEVRCGDTGKGVAAKLYVQFNGGLLLPLGQTEASGIGEVVVPDTLFTSVAYFADAAGYCMGNAHPGESQFVTDKTWAQLRPGKSPDFHANLEKGQAMDLQVLLGPDAPADRLVLEIAGTSVHRFRPNSRSLGFYTRLVRTDEQGRVSIGGVAADAKRFAANAELSAAHCAKLPAEWRDRVHPGIHGLLDRALAQKTRGRAVVDLSTWCPVQFELRDPEGLPASGARIWPLRTDLGYWGAEVDGPLVDRNGRLFMLVDPEVETMLLFAKGDAALAKRLVVDRTVRAAPARVSVRLPEPVRLTGVVLGKNGKPAAGMTLWRYIGWNGLEQVDDPADEPSRAPAVAAAKHSEVRLCAPTVMQRRSLLSFWMSRTSTMVTDKAGRFEFRVPPVPMRYTIHGTRSFLGLFQERVNHSFSFDGKSAPKLELVTR